MERKAFKMYLKPGFEIEYEKRHNEIWPELKQLIQYSGVYDYSIFLDKETNILFATHKVKSAAVSINLGNNPIVLKWWAYMADIMETNPDNSPKLIELKEVVYIE